MSNLVDAVEAVAAVTFGNRLEIYLDAGSLHTCECGVHHERRTRNKGIDLRVVVTPKVFVGIFGRILASLESVELAYFVAQTNQG